MDDEYNLKDELLGARTLRRALRPAPCALRCAPRGARAERRRAVASARGARR